jgi:outer membrane protein assembly factor BamB
VLGGVGPRSTPTIRDGVVYATGATGWLHALEGSTGTVLWRKNVLDDLGIAVDEHAAAVAWGRAGSPLVTEALVIVPGGGPLRGEGGGAVSLVAYDRATGGRTWQAGGEQISYVSPALVAIGGRDVVLAVNESSVAAYDPRDGRELWSFPAPSRTCSPTAGSSSRRATASARRSSRPRPGPSRSASGRCGRSRPCSRPSSRTS